MALFYVENDAEYVRVRRKGRFTMEAACAASPAHHRAAVRGATKQMIVNMAHMGYEYVDDGRLELRGPLPHLEVSESSQPDRGPLDMPDPRDVLACMAFERAEKAKIAKDVNGPSDMIDFMIVATFKRRVLKDYHVAARLAGSTYQKVGRG